MKLSLFGFLTTVPPAISKILLTTVYSRNLTGTPNYELLIAWVVNKIKCRIHTRYSAKIFLISPLEVGTD